MSIMPLSRNSDIQGRENVNQNGVLDDSKKLPQVCDDLFLLLLWEKQEFGEMDERGGGLWKWNSWSGFPSADAVVYNAQFTEMGSKA